MARHAEQDAVDAETFERLLAATGELDEPYRQECRFVLIAAGRLGLLGVALDRFGLQWPTLGGTTLGVVGSYRVYLTRSTLLNATFMWVAYGTVWLSLWVEPFPWFEVAATIAVASTVAYPWLSASARRARLARLAFQLGGVAVLLAVVDLLAVFESGFVRYPAVLGLALFLVVLDALPLVADLRGRSRPPDP